MHKGGLKSLIKSSAGTLVRQVGAGLLQLLMVVVIARALGPEGNGQFAIALLLPTTLSRFLEMGLPAANAHFIGSQKISPRTAFTTALQWFVLLAPVGIAIGAVGIWLAGDRWFPSVPTVALWLMLAAYPVLLLQAFLTSIFHGLQAFTAYNITLLLHPALALALSFGLVATGRSDVTSLLAAYLLGAVLTLIVSAQMLYRYFKRAAAGQQVRSQGLINFSYSRRAAQYALVTHIGTTLAFLNYRADVYLLNLLGSAAETGLYVTATQMVEKLWLLSAAVGVVLMPYISRISSEADKIRKVTPLMCIGVSLLTGIAGIMTALLSAFLVGILFGDDYAPAAVIMQLLLPGIVAWAGARVLAIDINARGKPELNMYMSFGVLVVNVCGNLLLIPRYGMRGAAIATTLAYCFFAVQMFVFYARLTRTSWRVAIADSIELSKQKLRVF